MTRERPSHHAHESYQTPFPFLLAQGEGAFIPQTRNRIRSRGAIRTQGGWGIPRVFLSEIRRPPCHKKSAFSKFFC